MANDVNANINIDINSGAAVAGLRRLQSEIGQFNKSVIASNAAAGAAQKALNNQLIQQVSSIKGFSSSIVNVQSDLSKLGNSIDKNKLSLGEYFRYGIASSKNFGKVFEKEHNQILQLAEDRVKRLQTQYVALGQSQNGVTRALASRPMHLFNSDMAISVQRQQLFNKLLRDGSTSILNWGKNTQWSGRQLMVGFTVPITLFGSIASKVFMDLEKQVVNFKRVYGDLGTTIQDTEKMVAQIQELGKEYTKYGISVSDTVALAAKAAAAGAQGNDLLAATEQATRLATLGQVDQNQALTATIALQSAFNVSSSDLASTIDFLNAVENQTVVSLDDITVAIPKVAPVIRGLGGDVKDLSVFLAAMREGGVNAAEGANALKSGLASMVNPTKAASESLKSAGINMNSLIKRNKGDLMGLVQDFGAELDNLDKFSRQQVLAKVFGKYQFARLGALFENINRDGSQAQRVIDLTGESIEDLAKLSEKELGNIEQSIGVKFLGAVERLKLAIAPIGKKFLEIVTPIISGVTKIIEKFNDIPEGLKSFIVIGTAIGAVVVPSIIMLIGLLANFAGNMLKIGAVFRGFIARIRGGGDAFNYYEEQELDAMAASASLDGKVNTLTKDLNLQRVAVNKLAAAYGNMATAARVAAINLPQGFRRPAAPRRMAIGGFVAGRGNKDTEPALLTPGEFVVNKKAAEKYGPTLEAMNSGKLKGFNEGGEAKERQSRRYNLEYAHVEDRVILSMNQMEKMIADLEAVGRGNSKAAKILKEAVENQTAVYGYSNVGIPLRGDVNAEMGRPGGPGATKASFTKALTESGSGSAAGIIDILAQKGLIDPDQMQEFGDTFYRTFSEQMSSLDKEFVVDADLSGPVRVAVERAAETLGTEVSQQAVQLIKEESSKITTIVSAKGQTHGGAGRASIAAEVSKATTSYRSRGGARGSTFRMLGGSRPSSVAAEASAMTTQAKVATQATQQSSSPSNVSKELGQEFGEGYALGIDSKQGRVRSAAGGLAQDASLGLKTARQSSMASEMGMAPGPSMDIITRKPSELMPRGGPPPPPGRPRAPMGFSEEEANNQTKRAGKVGKSFNGLATKIGGVSIAATMAAGAFSGMEGPVGEFANKIFPVLGFLDLLTIPLMFIGGGGGAAAGAGLTAAGAGATTAATGVGLLTTALSVLTAPITLIIAGIALLAVAFKTTYDRFEPLREAVSSLIETIKMLASEIIGDLVTTFKQMFGITDKAGASFGGFGEILQNIANVLGPIFTVVIKMITLQFKNIANQIKIVMKVFQIFFNIGKMVVGMIIGGLGMAFTWVVDKLGPVGDKIKEIASIVGTVFTNIPSIVQGVFNSVVGFIEDAMNSAIEIINKLIRFYQTLPEKLRPFGDIAEIADISLTTTTQQTFKDTDSGRGVVDGSEGRDGNVVQGSATTGTGLTDAGAGGGGEKEKTFLENLIAQMSANEQLYLTAQNVGKKYILAKGNFFGIFEKLRGMGVSESIISALGTDEEGLKNAKELLGKSKKEIKNIVERFAQANVLGPAVEAARKKIAEASNKRKAEGVVNASSVISFTDVEKKTLLGDQSVIDAINAASIKGKGALNEYLSILKQTLQIAKGPVDFLQQEIDDITLANRLQTRSSEDKVRGYQKQIDVIDKEIEAMQKLNNLDQERIKKLDRQKEMISRQIEELEKQNSINQKTIESLQRQDSLRQRVSDNLSRDLDEMSRVEQQIKESYDKRVEALDEVSRINDHIISQQKDQLSISQALSSGDIYAATAAAASARQNQIKESQENIKSAMQRGMENQVAGLTTAEGLTRKQVEQQISNIKEQSYQVSLQVRDIEDVIYERNLQIVPLKDQQLLIDTQIRDINDQIYIREESIKFIQDTRLEPLNKALELENEIKKTNDDIFKRNVDDLNLRKDLADLTDDEAKRVYNLAQQWNLVGNRIAEANRLANEKKSNLAAMPQRSDYKSDFKFNEALDKYNAKVSDIEKERAQAIKDIETPYAGGMMTKYYGGGMASKKYYGGSFVSGAGGRDSIPALLTPGEFIMRKSAVDKYGSSMLSKMNMGAFKMPNYSMGQKDGLNINSKTTNKTSINAPMYNNYSVSVSVSGTNASADEIANKAVMKIKQMQNTAVRSGRGY